MGVKHTVFFLMGSYNALSAYYFLACVAGLYTTLENGGALSALSELIAFVKFAHYSA